MAKIIPIRDLRKCAEISEYVRTNDEPIFVTRNGYGEMVIMNIKTYERQFAEYAMDEAIMRAVEEYQSGVPGKPVEEVFARIKSKIEAKKC